MRLRDAGEKSRHVFIQTIHEGVFFRPRVRAKRLRRLNKYLVVICSKYLHRFLDEVVQRHRLFCLLTVHQFCTHPGRCNLKHLDTTFPEKESLREDVRMESCLCC